MQVYVNEKYIADRARMGRRTSMIGLGILALGMVATFLPGWMHTTLSTTQLGNWYITTGWMIVAFASLLAGFILGQLGNYNVRQFQRTPRPDQVVAKALKGFDDRNRLYAWATPGNLVVAGPSGIFAVVTRGLAGQVTVIDDNVKRSFSFLRVLKLGQEAGGTPAKEASDAAGDVSAWLTKELSAEEAVPVAPLVVFTSDAAELDVQSASAPIIHHKKVKDYLRTQTRPAALSKEVLQAAINRLDEEENRRGAQLEV